MARSRNLKPGLFKNEILGVEDPLKTLAFAGSWLLADREGRLEDRPLRIKAEIFPYRDGVDVNAILDWLHAEGFILRYQTRGKRYIQILNFSKHQNPHKNETASEIPAPDDIGSITEKIGTTSEKLGSTRADSLLLIPDSPLPGSDADASVAGSKLADDPSAARKNIPDCPHLEIIELYKKHLPMLAAPRIWEGKKVEALRARWRWVLTNKKTNGDRYATDLVSGLKFFDRYFAYAAESEFLTGRNGKWTHCDLAWLLTAENFIKVLESKYHDREAST